jgi:hypothetical protein
MSNNVDSNKQLEELALCAPVQRHSTSQKKRLNQSDLELPAFASNSC